MSTCTRIRMSVSLLSRLPSTIFSQAAIDSLPIKVLTDHPVGQASEFILVIIQIIVVVKQKLRKLGQDFPLRILVLQLHERPWSTTVLNGISPFACCADWITLLWVKGE